MVVAPSTVSRVLLNLLLVLWVVQTLPACLNFRREFTVGVWVVGDGSVDFASLDVHGTCSTNCFYPDDGDEWGDSTESRPTEDVSILTASGNDFQHWVCYSDGSIEIKPEPQISYRVLQPGGGGGNVDCLAVFGTVRRVTFQIEHDPPALAGSVALKPRVPPQAACQDDSGLVPTGSPCICHTSCVLFAKDNSNVTAFANNPGVDLTIVDESCPGLNFLANSDDLNCRLRLRQPRLSIHITGNGKVTSDPSGIDCQGVDPLQPDAGTCTNIFAVTRR